MNIAIASGKGGTGKTFLSVNISLALKHLGKDVSYLDCDVEAPNGHLFLKPEDGVQEKVTITAPLYIDKERCTACGACAEFCQFNALALLGEEMLLFPELCHVCGGCSLVCKENAIIEGEREIGHIIHGKGHGIPIHYGLLQKGAGGMTTTLIKEVKGWKGEGINILDAPPGTACPAVETVQDSSMTILITEPTPFGLHDLKMAVDMCRQLKVEPMIVINRDEEGYGAIDEYCRKNSLEIIGRIPYDEKISAIYSRGGLIFEEYPKMKAILLQLAQKMIQRAGGKGMWEK